MEKKDGDAGDVSGEKTTGVISDDKASVDLFYEKICKLNESSGLSLVFNFRKTMLDLHSFYNEVIKRGGFYQVTTKGKWDDVASASNFNSTKSMTATQLRTIYEMLVLQYELMYSGKVPDAFVWPEKKTLGSWFTEVKPSCSTGKQKLPDGSPPSSTTQCGDGAVQIKTVSFDDCVKMFPEVKPSCSTGKQKLPDVSPPSPTTGGDAAVPITFTEVKPSCSTGKRKLPDVSPPSSTTQGGDDAVQITTDAGKKPEQKKASLSRLANTKSTESSAEDLIALMKPMKPRTAYHIFIRLEINRLKSTVGEGANSKTLREQATIAWKSFSEEAKKPYVEASKMDKERYEKEMAVYYQQLESQNAKKEALSNDAAPSRTAPSKPDDVYRVSLEDNSRNCQPPDEAMVELAMKEMKKAESNDSIFQVDLVDEKPAE